MGRAPAGRHHHVPQLGPSAASSDLLRGTAGRMTVLPSEIEVHSYLAESDERALADDVLDGLTRPFKELPPKHFYDARGAELFDRICDLPEYYPTRTERATPQARSEIIVELTGAAHSLELPAFP